MTKKTDFNTAVASRFNEWAERIPKLAGTGDADWLWASQDLCDVAVGKKHFQDISKRFNNILWWSKTDLSCLLDIGCGTGIIGFNIKQLNSSVKTVHGIDIADKAIEIARKKHPNGVFSVQCATRLTYPDDMFSAVVSYGAFMYMSFEEANKALCEALRVTAPGGVIIVSGLNDFNKFDPEDELYPSVSEREHSDAVWGYIYKREKWESVLGRMDQVGRVRFVEDSTLFGRGHEFFDKQFTLIIHKRTVKSNHFNSCKFIAFAIVIVLLAAVLGQYKLTK